ncbi:MAG: hypothetical protein ABI268_04990, partial [Rhodanobacter sp.]
MFGICAKNDRLLTKNTDAESLDAVPEAYLAASSGERVPIRHFCNALPALGHCFLRCQIQGGKKEPRTAGLLY